MIRFVPSHWLSWNFQVFRNDELVATLHQALIREAAEVEISGRQCRLYRERFMGGDFMLEVEGQLLARASKPSALRQHFDLIVGDRRFSLKRESIFRRAFDVYADDEPIGEIRPEAWYTRRSILQLPEDWPVALQVFVGWLVVLMWKRDAAAASSG